MSTDSQVFGFKESERVSWGSIPQRGHEDGNL